MKVKLLRDVLETNATGDPVGLKVTLRKSRATVPFVKDAVIHMSDASGKKYIERGWAEEVKDVSEKKVDATSTEPTGDTPKAAAPPASEGSVLRRGGRGGVQDKR